MPHFFFSLFPSLSLFSFILFIPFFLMSAEKQAPTHNPSTGPRPKNLPFSSSLGVGNHSKTQAEALSPDPPGFLPVYNHPSSPDLGRNRGGRQSLLQPGLTPAKEPIPRPPGQEALWISAPRGHRQPAPNPPSPHREAQPARGAASSAPPAGVTLGHSAAPSHPSFPIRALPEAAPRDTQQRAGRWGGAGGMVTSAPGSRNRSPHPPTFVKETKLSSLRPARLPHPHPQPPTASETAAPGSVRRLWNRNPLIKQSPRGLKRALSLRAPTRVRGEP